jgi:hypothetical protein
MALPTLPAPIMPIRVLGEPAACVGNEWLAINVTDALPASAMKWRRFSDPCEIFMAASVSDILR